MKRICAILCLTGWTVSSYSSGSQDLMREGLRLAKEGKTDLAMQTLRHASESDATDDVAATALGMVALEAQRYDVARPALERAVVLNPKSQTALYSLAMLYEKLKRYPDARYAWQRFLNLSPSADLADIARRHLDRLP